MPTAFDPDQAVQTGLLGATGPVQVTFANPQIDYFDYTKKDGTVTARTVAALIDMLPDGEVDEAGNPRSYRQMYSIGDIKSHHPNPDKATFEGPLVKGSNFNFLIENLINAGFPKHLLVPGDIRVLSGVVAVVEQKKPPTRAIQGKTDDSANKAQVVPIKIIHPAPGEEWPTFGKPVIGAKPAVGGGVKKVPGPAKAAAAPAKPKSAPAAPAAQTTTSPAAEASEKQVEMLATSIVSLLIQEAGEAGCSAKGTDGSLAEIGKKATYKYMKSMQAKPQEFPPNLRAAVVKLCQTPEWLGGGERPWVYDPDLGLLVAG